MKKMIPKLSTFLLAALLLLTFKTPVQASDAAAFAPVFDSTYYAEANPDLKAALGTDEAILLYHFLASGMAEGRQANAEFNVQTYRQNYADLSSVFGDNLSLYYMHYIQSGKTEGRVANQSLNAAQTPAIEQSNSHPMFTAEQWNYANRVIELVNQQRAAHGLGSVSGYDNLFSAAQDRALETETLFSHTRPNGESCFTIFDKYSVPYGWAGENIAAGQRTPEEVVEAWMNSPGHRANILNGHFNHLGVGCHTTNTAYRFYWVQMFTD